MFDIKEEEDLFLNLLAYKNKSKVLIIKPTISKANLSFSFLFI